MTSIARKIVTGLTVAGAAAALSIGGAATASAQQFGSFTLTPGNGACTSSQYASYQVRVDGSATNQGAKFKLLRNGVVIQNTSSRVPAWSVELRSSYGTFAGPGYYSFCAQNTGTQNTVVNLQLRTDAEF